MGYSHTFILVLIISTILDISLAACPKQNPRLLEEILSPSNAERALQILRLAAVGANRVNPPGGLGLLEEIALPRYLPNSVLPSKQFAPEFYPRRLPLPRQVVGQPLEVQSILQKVPEIYPPAVAPTVIQEKVYPAMPIPQPCPCMGPAVPEYPSAPVPLVNPFLPAASPVSAMAPPTSSLLPPVVPTQVRSHFLRKIPIPPPYL